MNFQIQKGKGLIVIIAYVLLQTLVSVLGIIMIINYNFNKGPKYVVDDTFFITQTPSPSPTITIKEPEGCGQRGKMTQRDSYPTMIDPSELKKILDLYVLKGEVVLNASETIDEKENLQDYVDPDNITRLLAIYSTKSARILVYTKNPTRLTNIGYEITEKPILVDGKPIKACVLMQNYGGGKLRKILFQASNKLWYQIEPESNKEIEKQELVFEKY